MLLSLIIILVGCCLVYIIACRKFLPKLNDKITSYPGQLPIFGHLHKFTSLLKIGGAYQFLASNGKFAIQNDGVYKLMIGPVPVYVVGDPEDVQTVLNRCLKKPALYKIVQPMLGKSLVAAEGDPEAETHPGNAIENENDITYIFTCPRPESYLSLEYFPVWKRNRRILDLGFKQHLIDEYLELFIEQADIFAQKLDEEVGKGEVDLTDKIARSMLETSCQTILGTRLNGEELVTDEYVKATHEFFKIMAIRIWMPWLLIDSIFNMSSYKDRSVKAAQTIFNFTDEMVHLRRSEYLQRLKNNESFDYASRRFKSTLDILIENSITETRSLFTHEELRNIVDNVLLASFDTNVPEMVFILVCIGSYPEVQEKIYEEILEILSKDAKVCRQNISQFIYLDAAIKEALRLYPVAMFVGRQTTVDTMLRNVNIPANSMIMVHLWAANRNTKYWGSDAHEFKPERWLSPSTLPDHQAAFASFSPGRRGCIGKSYALLNIKAILLPIIRKYKLTADHTKLKLDLPIMLKPLSGHFIKIERR